MIFGIKLLTDFCRRIFMKIGILSDTHGDYKCFEMAYKYLSNCNHIIHCGDTLHGNSTYEDKIRLAEKIRNLNNIVISTGNCDSLFDIDLIGKKLFKTPYATLNLGKYNFFITHGHRYSYLNMLYKAKELNCNIICYGHTHIKDLDLSDDVKIINPGSVSQPRDAVHSIAIIENENLS